MCTVRFLFGILAASLAVPSFALEPDQVYAKVAPSVVVVTGYDSARPSKQSLGSGVIIARGQIITNCHVVEDTDVIYLSRGDVKTQGIVRYRDPDRDLCQIGATDPTGFEKPVSYVSNMEGLRVGQKVYAIGAPHGLELTLSDGLISSLRSLPIGTVIQTNAPVSPGSSGGGLFDSSGRLIGITSFIFRTGQNLNFAVPASWIGELASRHKLREEEERKRVEAEAAARAIVEEQRRIEAEARRVTEEARLEQERRERAAAAERAKQAAEEARQKARLESMARQEQLTQEYIARIRSAIQRRIVIPPNVAGNPEARFDVVMIPGGEVLSITLRKSSGVPALDTAVERAISAAQPLPVPSDPDLFQEKFREISLTFRPRHKDDEPDPLTETDSVNGGGSKTSLPEANASRPIVADETTATLQKDAALIADYQKQVSRKISSNLRYPLLAQRRGWEGTVELLISVQENGRASRVSLVKSSGNVLLDTEAMNMAQRAMPFPPPPPELLGREHTLTVPVIFKLGLSESVSK